MVAKAFDMLAVAIATSLKALTTIKMAEQFVIVTISKSLATILDSLATILLTLATILLALATILLALATILKYYNAAQYIGKHRKYWKKVTFSVGCQATMHNNLSTFIVLTMSTIHCLSLIGNTCRKCFHGIPTQAI